MRSSAGAAVALGVLALVGCETTTAPVSERRVQDYRQAARVPAPQPTQPPAPKPAPTTASQPTAAAQSTKPTESQSAKTPAPKAAAPALPPAAAPPSKPSPTAAATPPPTPSSEPIAVAEGAPEGDWRPENYTVKRGDTLYSIALDHGLDYKELAAWNQLEDPNVIKVGQQLRLRPPPGWKPEPAEHEGPVARPVAAQPPVEAKALEAPVPVKSEPKGFKVPYSEQALAQLTRDPGKAPAAESKPAGESAAQARPTPLPAPAPVLTKPAPLALPATTATPKPADTPSVPVVASTAKVEAIDGDGSTQWVWPTAGKLLHPFNQGTNPKGVAIGGTPGQPVMASATGKVVYSGSGLRGYGKLIIIKHNNTYLSVYAHNRELLVKEGERVSRGQKIAEMGSDSDQVGLHFEIRRLGKPVDPLKYLPQDGA